MKINTKVTISMLVLLVAFGVDIMFATTTYLFSLSVVLGLQIIIFNTSKKQFTLNPLAIFSVMYVSYAIGGGYYAFSDGMFGKFTEFLKMERYIVEGYLVNSLIYVNISYVAVAMGYKIFVNENTDFSLKNKTQMLVYYFDKAGYLVAVLISVGGAYWVWVSHTIAGGVLNSLVLFQVFPHLVEEHKISTAPYLLYYAGVNIWLMKMIAEKARITLPFYIFSSLGFIIAVSTARISIALTYVFAQLYLLYMIRPESRNAIHKTFVALVFIGFILFFLREISNFLFINDGQNIADFNINIFSSLIGGGNVADLQQLVIIFYTFDLNNILYGVSYFDWLNNSMVGLLDLQANSVGLRIANLYVPETSGSPTPGAIGEAYANFHILGPVVMFCFGVFLAVLNNYIAKSKSLIEFYLYSCFVTSFVFLYPKVDSTMIANFFWSAFPTLLIFILFYIGVTMLRVAFSRKAGIVS